MKKQLCVCSSRPSRSIKSLSNPTLQPGKIQLDMLPDRAHILGNTVHKPSQQRCNTSHHGADKLSKKGVYGFLERSQPCKRWMKCGVGVSLHRLHRAAWMESGECGVSHPLGPPTFAFRALARDQNSTQIESHIKIEVECLDSPKHRGPSIPAQHTPNWYLQVSRRTVPRLLNWLPGRQVSAASPPDLTCAVAPWRVSMGGYGTAQRRCVRVL